MVGCDLMTCDFVTVTGLSLVPTVTTAPKSQLRKITISIQYVTQPCWRLMGLDSSERDSDGSPTIASVLIPLRFAGSSVA